MTTKRPEFKRPRMVNWLSEAVFYSTGASTLSMAQVAPRPPVVLRRMRTVAFAGLCVAQGEARAVTASLDGTALASDPVVLADDAEGVGAVGEISRQLVQQRTRAEDLGREIDGEVPGDGRCCGSGGRC